MQLQQRTITLDPVDALAYGPLRTVERLSSPSENTTNSSQQNNSSVAFSSSNVLVGSDSRHVQKLSSLSSVTPIPPPDAPNTNKGAPRPDSARRSKESTRNDRRDTAQYKPMATTVTKTGLFGIGKRTKVEPVVNPPENPLVDEYLTMAMEDARKGIFSNASIRSAIHSISTSTSSTCEADHLACNSLQSHQSSSPDLSQRPLGPIISSDACHVPTVDILPSNKSIYPVDLKILLPSEFNNYAGFCKGAWRQQTGDRKRAVEERLRPGGMYNAAKYYQCKHCKFEGRVIPTDKKKGGFDMRVFKLVQGIQFRWEFMFKSHVQVKEACSDPTKATFGCIFCCAEGKGNPIFGGIQSFMNHLLVHREHLPTGEVLYRMNCLVGRQAAMTEDFDINIISIEAGKSGV